MSALLPNSHKDFQSKEYWDEFFENKKSFEWFVSINISIYMLCYYDNNRGSMQVLSIPLKI